MGNKTDTFMGIIYIVLGLIAFGIITNAINGL